jgi:hypothetical protein
MARKSRFELHPSASTPNKKDLSETASAPFPVLERELLARYAELQYKTRGGGKCSQCRAPVRHALRIRAERADGGARSYVCLCARCLVAEEALSTRVLYQVAGQWVESRQPRKRNARHNPGRAA